ncbi:hypothetical protein B7486_67130 [cyanobacterium TDX16]|nr:hypothetical protein B7486_67130 [cyanobacterium TDX16]
MSLDESSERNLDVESWLIAAAEVLQVVAATLKATVSASVASLAIQRASPTGAAASLTIGADLAQSEHVLYLRIGLGSDTEVARALDFIEWPASERGRHSAYAKAEGWGGAALVVVGPCLLTNGDADAAYKSRAFLELVRSSFLWNVDLFSDALAEMVEGDGG